MPAASAAAFSWSIVPMAVKASRAPSAAPPSAKLPWSSAEPTIARGANDGSGGVEACLRDFVGYFHNRFHGLHIVHSHHVNAIENRRGNGCRPGEFGFEGSLARQEVLAKAPPL